MVESQLKDRVKKFLAVEHVSNSEFAKMAGVSAAYISSIKKNIGLSTLQKLVKINPSVNLSFLLFGVGSMYNASDTEIEKLRAENKQLSEKVLYLSKIVDLYEQKDRATNAK